MKVTALLDAAGSKNFKELKEKTGYSESKIFKRALMVFNYLVDCELSGDDIVIENILGDEKVLKVMD